jgi:group I intron endonuclease
MGWIYLIRNKVNGKCYVGQTSQEKSENRWSQHKYRPHGLLKFAFEKYGFENFEFSTICEIPEGDGWRESLDAREIIEINARNTLTPHGYNLQTGGNHPIVHQETKEKIRESKKGDKNYNYGKHLSDETKARMSASISGEKHWNFGKKASGDSKIKMKQSHINLEKGKEVEQWSHDRKTLIEVHKSLAIAARKLDISSQGISRCCCGKRPSSGGFFWKLHREENLILNQVQNEGDV